MTAPLRDGWAMVHKAVLEDRRLTKAQRLVYAALCAHAYRDQASVSFRVVAETAQVHRVTAIAALRTLRDCGHVTWEEHTGSRGGRLAHTYTIAPLTAYYAARSQKKGGPPVPSLVASDYHPGSPALPGCSPHATTLVAPPDHTNKDQDVDETDETQREFPLPDLPDLTPALLALYTRLAGHAPPPAIAEILATHLATVGEMRLSAMMLESHTALGVITPGSLIVARRKLDRSRRGNVIRVPPPAPRTELPPLPDERNPTWRAVLAELRMTMTRENFTHWLVPTRVIEESSDSLTLAVPSQFHAEWLRLKLKARVDDTLRKLGHEHLRIEYAVSESLKQATDTSHA